MKYSVISFFLCLVIGSCAYADQVIYIDVADFIPDDSDFGVEVDGNEWIEVNDPDALDGQAFGSPGDNDYNGANPPGTPFLVYEFPVDIKAGESTADGETWVPWARMRVPSEQNSFFWQVSIDKGSWMPEANDSPNRWNNDGMNGSNEWYWQDNTTGNDGGVFPDIEVGLNYFRLGTRESDPVNFPTIDVVCFRNDGKQPSDGEAEDYLSSVRPREPERKLTPSVGTWGIIKNSPVMYIEKQSVDVNTLFDVDVRISSVKNLTGFQVSLSYDPINLQFMEIQEGKALLRNGQTSFWRPPNIDAEAGIITGAVSVIEGAGGVDVEDDVLMTLTFKAKELGRSMISLQDVKISDPASSPIPFLAVNADITILAPWDVVPDSVIDVLDMVAVGQHLGNSELAALLAAQEGIDDIPDIEIYNADVDRNGTVDVDDLILVSDHFGEVYTDLNTVQLLSPRSEIRKAYDLISAGPANSSDVRKLKAHLARLLAAGRATSLPISHRLLPNYPNPFNPDTWIPYHLAQAGDVVINIYNTSGQLMRTLNLGYKEAGVYTDKSKSAHWDGKNSSGEQLASGLYFYVMRAGYFTAARKMLLVE